MPLKDLHNIGKIIDNFYNSVEIPSDQGFPLNSIYLPSDDTYLFINYLKTSDFERDLMDVLNYKINHNVDHKINHKINHKSELRPITSIDKPQISMEEDGVVKIYFLDMGCGTGVLGLTLLIASILYIFKNNLRQKFEFNIDFVDINPNAIKTARNIVSDKNNIDLIHNLLNDSILTGADLGSNDIRIDSGNILKNISYHFHFHQSDLFEYFYENRDATEKSSDILGAIKPPDKELYLYDLIIFNPPYLPSDPKYINENNKHPIDFAWDSGDTTGNFTIIKFFKQFFKLYKDILENNQHSYIDLAPRTMIYFIGSSSSDLADLEQFMNSDIEKYINELNIREDNRINSSNYKDPAFKYTFKEVAKTHIFFEDIILYKFAIFVHNDSDL
ncbi:MAG: hypothetical protein ACTSU2_00390 [Promethearchaeota archaeon]